MKFKNIANNILTPNKPKNQIINNKLNNEFNITMNEKGFGIDDTNGKNDLYKAYISSNIKMNNRAKSVDKTYPQSKRLNTEPYKENISN